MRVTRGYGHAERRNLHRMMIRTRGSSEVNKQTIRKKRYLFIVWLMFINRKKNNLTVFTLTVSGPSDQRPHTKCLTSFRP